MVTKAPRGGLVEKIAGKPRKMRLENEGVERFEDVHGSIFQVWDGFTGKSTKPTRMQVLDLVTLGLIGCGMDEEAASKLISNQGPDQLQHLYSIAQALIGIAFMPDMADETDDAPASEGDSEKKI